ncbi:MAG TPA: hypothetical protein VIQ76_19670 [Propionibacteriaceae bacterium]|jgi:hypothetical protein
MCAWLGLSAYGSYDHHNSVEAERAQRHGKIIVPARAAYRAGLGTHGVRDDHDFEFRRWPFLTARLPPQAPLLWSCCQRPPNVPPYSPSTP